MEAVVTRQLFLDEEGADESACDTLDAVDGKALHADSLDANLVTIKLDATVLGVDKVNDHIDRVDFFSDLAHANILTWYF